jgi:uncharacterized protein (UPF0276 family)
MIQIGCNYSHELIELLKEEAIEIDWIKLANEHSYDDQFQHVDGIRPCLFHIVPCTLSHKHLNGWNINRVNQSIHECKSPHVGVHFRGALDNYNNRELIKKYVVKKIREWKSIVKCEYLIENMALNRLPSEQHILTEPSFIKEVCEEAEIGLLLDISHLKVSAYYLGMTENEYLHKLPLYLVREIHVNGPRKNSDGYFDAHESMRKEDYTFLEEVLKVTKPRIVTLEYGGDEEKKTCSAILTDQLSKIKILINLCKD